VTDVREAVEELTDEKRQSSTRFVQRVLAIRRRPPGRRE
jgi:hypothetical protein